MRWRMIETERSRSAGVSLWPGGGDRLEHDLEAALEVEPLGRRLVYRRARDREQRDARDREEQSRDEDEMGAPVRQGV